MAPSWVLLDRDLSFSHDEAVFAGDSTACASEKPPTEQDYSYAITAYLRSLKPAARLADPPGLSSLTMLQPTKSVPPLCGNVTSACISSADKRIVALYAGCYRPCTLGRGCHLIYDASNNSLSTIPQLPYRRFHAPIGCHSALVVCDGDEDGAGYMLAELTRDGSTDVGEAALYLWYPSAQDWVVKEGTLPSQVCPRTVDFSAGMCFHYRRTSLCWVDLLKGMVVCQRFDGDPKFSFVPLPDECPTYDALDPQVRGWHICGEEFRSMSCVGELIRFVTMDGYVDRRPGELKLTLWTLAPDFSGWVKSKVYDVGNIWASEIYQSTGMGKIYPSFPVLSMNEAHVIYLVFTDIRAVASNVRGIRVVANDEVDCRGQYVIRVDMENSELQLCQASTQWIIHAQLFASEFSAYRQGLDDNPSGRSKGVTESGKRMKL